jgi:hypothetical protein
MLAEIVQKVLEKTAQHMYVQNFAQIGRLMSLDESLLQVFDLRVGPVDPIEADFILEETSLLDFIDDHLHDRRYVGRFFVQYIVTYGSVLRKVKGRIAGTREKLLALGVDDHVAFAAFHDHFAEFGAFVAVSAQF